MMQPSAVHCLAVTLIAGVTLISGKALAQDLAPPGVAFAGEASTGTDTRAVRFRFFCSSNQGPNITGVLAVELEVPQYEQLRALFDFDPFEGPDANAGPLTSLQANGARSKASDRFTAAGSAVPSGATESFVLSVAASRRETQPLRKLAAVLRPLTDGPASLVWRQGNVKAGGAPLVARLDLAQAQVDQLKHEVGPCVGIR